MFSFYINFVVKFEFNLPIFEFLLAVKESKWQNFIVEVLLSLLLVQFHPGRGVQALRGLGWFGWSSRHFRHHPVRC
jgi:hypothetical protein